MENDTYNSNNTSPACDNSLDRVSFAFKDKEYHHRAIWEEEKHFTWFISILLSAIVLIFVSPNIGYSAKCTLIIMGSLLGISICLTALAVIRREGEYFFQALKIYVEEYNKAYPEYSLQSLKDRANKPLTQLFRSIFKRTVSIRDRFQIIFVIFFGFFSLIFIYAIISLLITQNQNIWGPQELQMSIPYFPSFLSANWWIGLQGIALIATLVVVIIYTVKTSTLAKATRKSVEIQELEMLYAQQPVISVFNLEPNNIFFRPTFFNYSNSHAKLRVKAKLIFDGKEFLLPENHLYAGTKIWFLQAGGHNAIGLSGNLDFPKILESNGYKGKSWDLVSEVFSTSVESGSIIMEISSVNINRSDDDLDNINCKNPPLQWNWNYTKRIWIPEVNPQLPHG
jgi:hypothetical protein